MTVPTSAPRRRDPWLDTARFVLIALVVFGHVLEPLADAHPWLHTCYRFVYAFHMPAFAFLSGAVAHDSIDTNALRGIVFRLLWPYLVFQGLYALAAQLPLWPDAGPGSVTTPYWLLWYLLSLACWRFLLPLFAHLRGRLLIAVLVAVGAGCLGSIGYYLSLSRTLVFFPLFLMGWLWAPRWRELSKPAYMRVLAACTLGAMFVAAWLIPIDPRWLYGSYGYAALGSGPLVGALQRLLLLGIAVAGTLAVLALVPRRHTPFSAPGARSLGAYVLQGFVIKIAVGAGFFAVLTRLPGAWLLPVLLVLAAVTAWVLASRSLQRLLDPITTPRWLEKRIWRPSIPAAHGQSVKR
ncbi:MAG TPA: acyltransferase family protein [Oleiagrimonas sp.]|nr:acyltransferase family protein [Oleiagrimonas sp.]